jgi:hypothetical protein
MITRGLGDTVLATQFHRPQISLGFLQGARDLSLAESPLDCRSCLDGLYFEPIIDDW